MILVTGATGNVGRFVVKMLLDAGQKVAAVTRNPAAAWLPAAAQVVRGNPSQPNTLKSALSGIEAVFLAPRALGDTPAQLLALAAEQGVQRAVLLSGVTVEHGGGHRRFADQFKAVEDAVKASGLQSMPPTSETDGKQS